MKKKKMSEKSLLQPKKLNHLLENSAKNKRFSHCSHANSTAWHWETIYIILSKG